MIDSTETTASIAGREIVISRVFDAPRELVFDAFTDARHISEWWGPRGFTTTTSIKDVRPGGIWRFIMHGPDGTDYTNTIRYTEVVRPERLAYDHGADDIDGDPASFQVTVTFVDQGGRTALTMRSRFTSEAEVERNRKFGAVDGGKQTLERLAEYLAKA
jgi:uncharacterized protein YndB with AHSA1/START domain